MTSRRQEEPGARIGGDAGAVVLSGAIIDDRLLAAFGDPLPADEAERWAAMSPERRKKALRRLDALQTWTDDRGSWTAADAAEAAGMSISRFYRTAAQWTDKEARSLGLLGTFADNPTKRRSRYDKALLDDLATRAAKVLADHAGKRVSTETIIDDLVRSVDAAGRTMPGRATLRTIVDAARRQTSAKRLVGEDLQFDCCACSIRRPDGRPHILYACADAASGLLLGFAFGVLEDSVTGHRKAAADVLSRLPRWRLAGLPWVPQAERAELVIGTDLEEFRAWEMEVRERAGQVNVQGSNRARRFGRYLKDAVGQSVGRILLLPKYTGDDRALAVSTSPEGFNEEEARARFELEMARHNRVLLKELGGRTPQDPPTRLERMLQAIAL